MKVKVGDQMFNSCEVPIMVILSDADKRNIANMDYDATKYAAFPKGFGTHPKMIKWMDIEKDHKK